jgi:hypothetical protein
MTSSPKKNYATAAAERELQRFVEAVDEFDCRSNEVEFNETLRELVNVDRPPRGEHVGSRVVPVRCDECYLKAELVQKSDHRVELFPAPAPNCWHLPVEDCPGLKAAFARARDG